jgi:Xaa-Pro aminopeptidase
MLYKEKLDQAVAILGRLGIDLWLTVGRETAMNSEPVIPLLSPIDFTAAAALIVTAKGEKRALIGHNDAEGLRQHGIYDEVVSYDTNFAKELAKIVRGISPESIALNYSLSDEAADGLTHGLYLKLCEIFKDAGFSGTILSSEPLIAELKGRKTEEELKRIGKAADTAERIFTEAKAFIRAGVTEKEIHAFFHRRMEALGVKPAWVPIQCPGVMVGPNSATGHNSPTDIVVQKGDSIDVDFGVLENEYCSDIQRTYYVREDGESGVCEEVKRAFDTLHEAVSLAAKAMRPGACGFEIDAAARDHVKKCGYKDWNYALGHQVGRFAHDGGIILAPQWERYPRNRVESPVMEGMVFTLEPGIATSRGYVALEEMVVVRKDGAEFISHRQNEVFSI